MKTKTFDCLKMKEDCQKAVEKAYGSLPLAERQAKMEADILADPVLGPFYERITQKEQLKAPETRASYKAGR